MDLNPVELHDELLARMPEGARHDADICVICVDKASSTQALASVPSGSEPSGASPKETSLTPEGGIAQVSDKASETLSRETHEALMAKAVGDATAAVNGALETARAEVAELTTKVAELETDNASLTSDNERLNKDLDTAQVGLKAATDEVASLKADVAAKEEAATKAELASKRAEQVTNLNLFPKEFVTERASRWAELADEDWAARVEEWQAAKPAATEAAPADTASALEGTTGDLTTEPAADVASATKIPARRSVLGLN